MRRSESSNCSWEFIACSCMSDLRFAARRSSAASAEAPAPTPAAACASAAFSSASLTSCLSFMLAERISSISLSRFSRSAFNFFCIARVMSEETLSCSISAAASLSFLSSAASMPADAFNSALATATCFSAAATTSAAEVFSVLRSCSRRATSPRSWRACSARSSYEEVMVASIVRACCSVSIETTRRCLCLCRSISSEPLAAASSAVSLVWASACATWLAIDEGAADLASCSSSEPFAEPVHMPRGGSAPPSASGALPPSTAAPPLPMASFHLWKTERTGAWRASFQ